MKQATRKQILLGNNIVNMQQPEALARKHRYETMEELLEAVLSVRSMQRPFWKRVRIPPL
jgi:hypothetical protein